MIVQDTFDESIVIILFIFFTFVLVFGGMIVGTILDEWPRNLKKEYKILKKLDSSDLVITRKFVLASIDDVQILAIGRGFLYFIAFRGAQREGESTKISVPKRTSVFGEQVTIAGIRLYVKEGVFTIPSQYGNYHTGNVLLHYVRPYPHHHMFTKKKISAIIEKISEEAKQDSNPQ